MITEFIKKWLAKQFSFAYQLNQRNIFSLLEKNKSARVLDSGCNDGMWTKFIEKKIGSKKIYGIDILKNSIKKSKKIGIRAIVGDLNKKLPYKSNHFDVIHSNQVIEHLWNVDLYISEINRVLKKGGYLIISTENGSSWHNIFSSILGWQTFSLASLSWKKRNIGNPLVLLRDNQSSLRFSKSDTHKIIFNYFGLIEFLKLYGFHIIDVRGSGYYPFPAFLGDMDKIHCHFMTFKFKKI